MKPKKLIREGKWISKFNPNELETVKDLNELNKLYILKIKEELQEIINSDFKDIFEFADLIQVCVDFAKVNGIEAKDLRASVVEKFISKGGFNNTALTNLNPENPSNNLYFDAMLD